MSTIKILGDATEFQNSDLTLQIGSVLPDIWAVWPAQSGDIAFVALQEQSIAFQPAAPVSRIAAGTALISLSGNGSACAMNPQCQVLMTQSFVGFVHT